MFNCGGEGGFYAKFVNIYDFKGLTIIGLPHLYHPFVATAGSIPRWGFEMRTISPEILPDGNPHKLPRMVPTRDWAPPSFPTHPSMTATVISHARGRDRRASWSATGRGNDPSI